MIQALALALTLLPSRGVVGKDVSALLAPIRAHHDLPGMTVCVLHHGEVVASGADGVRERGEPAAITVDDQMHLGSCTKAMTATVCAMLVDEGKLAWDTTIESAFPDLASTMQADWKSVRLDQLLAHRAGAPAELTKGGLWAKLWAFDGSPEEARMMLVKGVLANAPASKPGTQFLYSNAGVTIAGVMAERAAHTTYEKLLEQRLFAPLGMTSAGFGAPGTTRGGDAGADQPIGHREGGSPVGLGERADNPPAITPAGRVHCSVLDWAKFVALHLEGEREPAHGEKPLVSIESMRKLHTELGGGEQRYALGWGVADRPWGGRVLTHSGSNTMWFCVVWMAPEKDFAVLVCCNQGGDHAMKACDEVAAAMIGEFLGQGGAKSKNTEEKGAEKKDAK